MGALERRPWHARRNVILYKKLILVCTFVLSVVVVAACGVRSTAPEEGAREAGAELDLETLTADTEAGTLQAERAANSYAGLIEEGRAIGVAFLEEVGAGEGQAPEDGIVVHLYDRQELAIMTGELDAEGAATLESADLSDFDATVELVMEGDVVSGAVTFPGEGPVSFTAEAATGDDVCGVYWAQGSDEDADASGDWVVLSDGSQWGCICIPPPTGNPCCYLRS